MKMGAMRPLMVVEKTARIWLIHGAIKEGLYAITANVSYQMGDVTEGNQTVMMEVTRTLPFVAYFNKMLCKHTYIMHSNS